jgi:hypothetical protein
VTLPEILEIKAAMNDPAFAERWRAEHAPAYAKKIAEWLRDESITEEVRARRTVLTQITFGPYLHDGRPIQLVKPGPAVVGKQDFAPFGPGDRILDPECFGAGTILRVVNEPNLGYAVHIDVYPPEFEYFARLDTITMRLP